MARKQAKKQNVKTRSSKNKISTKSHDMSQLMDGNPLFCNISTLIPKLVQGKKANSQNLGMVYVYGQEPKKEVELLIKKLAPTWQKKKLLDGWKKSPREVLQFVGNLGPVWILAPKVKKGPFSHGGRLEESVYAWMREQAGSLLGVFKAYSLENVQIDFFQTDEIQELGFFVGLEMAAYSYKSTIEGTPFKDLPKIHFKKWKLESKKLKPEIISESLLQSALVRASSVNLARHLVNTPPNFLNPTTLSILATETLSSNSAVKVEVWDMERLKQEGMGLHIGVGQGSEHPPCLVKIQYRPAQTKENPSAKKMPIAIVGKGISFDTGGLDIKPSSGMRLMKKDMGGAAAVLGLAKWTVDSKYPRPLDFYLALAENSVDSKSMRPSDVLVARNGMKVEIHNTDAEGRLVLADALDVAVTQKGADEPEMVINLATLTGAIKVALGADLAGLFSNHDELAEELNQCGQQAGDLNWRMPLFGKMNSNMSTPFADIVNAVDGFGGAITAALFLEKFVKQKPWAHLDIYAWNDKATGSLSFSGGSGQPVQALIEFLLRKV